VFALWLSLSSTAALGAAPRPIPDDFPEFIVPGHEKAMAALRRLYHLHYSHYWTRKKPMPTVWDGWLPGPTLWPASGTEADMQEVRRHWAEGLSARIVDPEGYVASHQYYSIAHNHGWPFPFWQQGGPGTWGWHFSLRAVPHNWDKSPPRTQEGWTLQGAADLGIAQGTWNIKLTAPRATVTTPPLTISPDQSPFIQLRWRADGLGDAQPCLEWATENDPEFNDRRRFYFDPARSAKGLVDAMIPLYKCPAWKGKVTRLRISLDNPRPGATVGIQSLFTQYDTRHNVNNACFLRGCCQYFHWTRDLNFLRANLQRMRLAMLYMMEDLGGRREKCIVTPFFGHDGRSGIEPRADGKKIIHSGRGICNNYWDILPMGYRDAYASIQYYDALRDMALLEQEVAGHPEWNLPAGPLALDPGQLRDHAGQVKSHAGRLFWNSDTGRFVAGIDRDGQAHDYGFTFVNCEAVCYGFADGEQAESIMQWLTGDRMVAGDTSQGADIYRWRFGPRSTTRRNLDWYGWYWYAPESLPWGGQVQDGGAVLGFSYHDLLARLDTLGPDNAWARLKEIIEWYREVEAAGGYRKYYKNHEEATLQGCGVCGGLGLDCEFHESILVPQIMINGFLGFKARADGFEIDPKLPRDWPELRVTQIRFHRLVLDLTADAHSVTIAAACKAPEPLLAYLPIGQWRCSYLDVNGNVVGYATSKSAAPGEEFPISFDGDTRVRFTLVAPG